MCNTKFELESLVIFIIIKSNIKLKKRQQKGHWIIDTPIANPMSIYPQYRQSRTSWGIGALGPFIVEAELENGMTGIGLSIGGAPACYIVEEHLSRFVKGSDIRDVERIWDQLYRATLPYGRKGLAIHAISAIDIAIWDLMGKKLNQPVFRLMGGDNTIEKEKGLPVYATTIRPDLAKEMGFKGAKFPLPYNHADNGWPMDSSAYEKNMAVIKDMRASVGPDFPLMIDCYMSLTPLEAIKLGKGVVKHNIKWIEEYLPPDDYEGYKQVREGLKEYTGQLLLTTGEHEYTRHGFKQLLACKAVDIVQPDVTWVGGITECRKIITMAGVEGVSLIPHGSGVYSYHLQYAFQNCPMAEYLVMSPQADTIVPCFGGVLDGEPLPHKGYVKLDDSKPGFGVTLSQHTRRTMKRPFPVDH